MTQQRQQYKKNYQPKRESDRAMSNIIRRDNRIKQSC